MRVSVTWLHIDNAFLIHSVISIYRYQMTFLSLGYGKIEWPAALPFAGSNNKPIILIYSGVGGAKRITETIGNWYECGKAHRWVVTATHSMAVNLCSFFPWSDFGSVQSVAQVRAYGAAGSCLWQYVISTNLLHGFANKFRTIQITMTISGEYTQRSNQVPSVYKSVASAVPPPTRRSFSKINCQYLYLSSTDVGFLLVLQMSSHIPNRPTLNSAPDSPLYFPCALFETPAVRYSRTPALATFASYQTKRLKTLATN
jgi:hypothetical protein